MRIALITAIFLAIGCSFLSPFLVFSNKSLIADGLSHSSFTGIIIGVLFTTQPVIFGIIYASIIAILITYISKKSGASSDAAIGILGTFSIALGFIITNLGGSYNISIESLLVGNLFAITKLEMILMIGISVILVLFVFLFYSKLILMVADQDFAKLKKIKVDLLDYILSILTSILVVLGVRAVGTLLISAFIVFPAIISKQFQKSFKISLFIGLFVSILTVFIGIIIGHYLKISAASLIVLAYTFMLLISLVQRKIRKI